MDMAKIFSHFVDCLLSHWLDFCLPETSQLHDVQFTNYWSYCLSYSCSSHKNSNVSPVTVHSRPLPAFSSIRACVSGFKWTSILFRIKNIDLFAHSSACRACYSLTSTTCWRCYGFLGMFCLFLCSFLLAFLYVSWFLSNQQVCVCHRNYICVYTSVPLINCLFVSQYIAWFSLYLIFGDRVSLCIPGCPGTYSVDQASLELRNLPASAFQVLELKACTTNWLAILQVFYCNRWLWLSRVFVLGAGNYPFKVYYKLLF